MIKFLIGVFVFLFFIPSMIFSLWAYFEDKKEAKNRKPPRPHALTHAQMMALLQPDGSPVQKPAQRPVQKIERPAAKKPVEQAETIRIKQAPHEIQTITLKREIYY